MSDGEEKPEEEEEVIPDPKIIMTSDVIQRGLQQIYRIPSKYSVHF